MTLHLLIFIHVYIHPLNKHLFSIYYIDVKGVSKVSHFVTKYKSFQIFCQRLPDEMKIQSSINIKGQWQH